MAGFNGSGQFSFTYNWVNDAANGVAITASRMDGQFNDAVSGFDLCLTRDNQGKPSASFLPDTTSAYDLGSPSFQWQNLYLVGAISFNGGPAFSQTVASWSPVDASGAGLVFTSISANYTRIGNIVHAYATLTYPATADGTQAKIGGLPVALPNFDFAAVPAIVQGTAAASTINGIKNTSTANIFLLPGRGAVLNSALSGLTLNFMFIYPAS